MMPKKESRQARRYRERHNGYVPQKRGVPTIPHPYVLFCRVEDDEQGGFWSFTGADSPEEGDQIARGSQRNVGQLSMRCDLFANTAEAIKGWAGQSVERTKALAEFGENTR